MLDNAALAELLAREGESSSGHLQRAYKRAARSAFLWPEEAAELMTAKRSLTELPGIGPTLAKKLRSWLESPPEANPPPIRAEFLTLAQARRVLAKHPTNNP